jgi:hypothetical protein
MKLTRNAEYDDQQTSQIATTRSVTVRSSPSREESDTEGKIPFCYVTNQYKVDQEHTKPFTSRATVSAAIVKRV